MPSFFRDRFRRRSSAPPPSSDGNGAAPAGRSNPGKSLLAGRSASGNNGDGRADSSFSYQQPQAARKRAQGGGGQPPLAAFDACIEACDALAATSQQRQRRSSLVSEGGGGDAAADGLDDSDGQNENDDRRCPNPKNDGESITDCSVLVSPDGALLFTSQSALCGAPNNHPATDDDDDDDNKEEGGRYPWTRIPSSDRDGAVLDEDYSGAVVCGDDLSPDGDRGANGFSGRGWNHDAATAALAASGDALRRMEGFVEELAVGEKESAARAAVAVGRLAGIREEAARGGQRQRRGKNNHFVAGRLGPMLSGGTDLSLAVAAVEEYYTSCAEGALERWTMACSNRRCSTEPESIELQELSDGQVALNQKAERLQRQQKESIEGFLPKLRTASDKAAARASERERALLDIRFKFSEAECTLRKQKEWARSRWQKVADEESNIDRLLAIKKMEQHDQDEGRRRRWREDAFVEFADEGLGGAAGAKEGPLSEEVWEMVQDVATSADDYGHTGYSPQGPRKPTLENAMARGTAAGSVPHLPHQHPRRMSPPRLITRADVERETEIADIRMVAHTAEESVEDAAGKLLNVMSKGDTTLRSARLAAESCLLSECNAMKSALTSLVALERASLEERTRRLDALEAAVGAVDVRKDIDGYIQNDKRLPGGRSRAGEDDDGGIAAALAVLNSHASDSTGGGGGPEVPRKYRNIERPSYFEGWGEVGGYNSCDFRSEVEPEMFGNVIKMLFRDNPATPSTGTSDEAHNNSATPQNLESNREGKIEVVSNALAEKTQQGQSSRKLVLYELNNQRSKNTRVTRKTDFHSLCRIFNSFLNGCGRESIDVSNAKMLMILSQTFYFVEDEMEGGRDNAGGGGGAMAKAAKRDRTSAATNATTKEREHRDYVKSKICHHDIWWDEDFWDQAVWQCVSESLAKSGVLLNYIKSSSTAEDGRRSNVDPGSGVKWHDLSPDEYAGAASQVHSVVFAQLGTLSRTCAPDAFDLWPLALFSVSNFVTYRSAFVKLMLPRTIHCTDSMIELGCGIPRACNFVRRLSIRYQLPMSLRITLIQHLTKNSTV